MEARGEFHFVRGAHQESVRGAEAVNGKRLAENATRIADMYDEA